MHHETPDRLTEISPDQLTQISKASDKPLHIQDAESELPFSDVKDIPVGYDGELQCVLLTGATGFLGIHILSEFAKTNTHVFCVVRAANKEHGLQRLHEQADLFEIELNQSQITILCGDINQECLGLGEEEWNVCCEQVQQIIHASAHVNHIEGYATFRDATRGMKEVIRLAASKKLKLIHFMSSIAACARNNAGRISIHEKEEFITDGMAVIRGYGQSKWVQETLIKRAHDHGIPFIVYRFGELSGSSKSGLGQTGDMLHRLLQMRLAVGCKEKISNDVVDMLPVDFAAQLVAVPKFAAVPAGIAQSRAHRCR
ncbi:MAG: NAD-dependent epimerase/dehydratase family protein, partial [Chitinophagaceae bacterium]